LCRWIFTPTAEELDAVKSRFEDELSIPLNFEPTVPPYDPQCIPNFRSSFYGRCGTAPRINPQTTAFCERLGIDDPMVLIGEFQ
jgi:lariat debranching enzyme